MPKHRIEIFLGLTWANAIFSLYTIKSMVAQGKMGGGLNCKALPEASPALWGSLLEDRVRQENAEKVCCSLVMCNTQAHGSAQNNRNCHAVSRNSQQRPGREEKATYRESSWLGVSSQLWVRVWKQKSFTKATVFICCWSHCPIWICLMPFKIHFQSPQPPEALTATMQLWIVGKSTSFWVCLF